MKHLPIGEQIRYYRKKRNFNQKQLATLASCSMDYLSMLERGLYYPNVGVLIQIAQALEIPVTRLLEDPSDFQLSDSENQQIWILADFQEDFERLEQWERIFLIELFRHFCERNRAGLPL